MLYWCETFVREVRRKDREKEREIVGNCTKENICGGPLRTNKPPTRPNNCNDPINLIERTNQHEHDSDDMWNRKVCDRIWFDFQILGILLTVYCKLIEIKNSFLNGINRFNQLEWIYIFLLKLLLFKSSSVNNSDLNCIDCIAFVDPVARKNRKRQ